MLDGPWAAVNGAWALLLVRYYCFLEQCFSQSSSGSNRSRDPNFQPANCVYFEANGKL